MESELGSTLNECKVLNDGISELESILANYNAKVNQLNSMASDDSGRGSIQSEISRLENDFKNKNKDLRTKHDTLLSKDGSSVILKAFTVTEDSVDLTATAGTNKNYTGKDKTTNIFYEVDGVIYQKVLPYYLKSGGVGSSYTIAYDKNAIIKAVGKDSEMGKKAISFLNSKLSGENNSATLWKMFGKSYSRQDYADIAKIMDVVLEASYDANGCKSVSDYATVAAAVATNSLVHMKCNATTTNYTKGFSQVIATGYDCIGFTNWAYYQGVQKVKNISDNNNANLPLRDFRCNDLFYHYGRKTKDMSLEERANIKPGSLIGRYGHTGIVLGTRKNENGGVSVVIAHSANSWSGALTYEWPVEKLTDQWTKVMTPEDMTKLAVKGTL